MPVHGTVLSVTRQRAIGVGLNFSALTALPVGRQSELQSAGITQAQINALANADIWIDAYGVASDEAYTTPALTGDPVASAYDNATGNLWTQANAANRMTLATGPVLTGGYYKTLSGTTMANTTAKVVIATSVGILVADANIPANFTIPNTPNTVHWVAGDLSELEINEIKAFAVAEGATDNDFASVTNFFGYFRLLSFLTSFPLIDTSSGTSFSFAWYWCSNLTSFPLIDTSSGTSFNSTWYWCSNLTSFPLIDTSSGTRFSFAWYGCSNLTSFPLIDTSSGTSFNSTWQNCSSLNNFPLIDTSSGTSFNLAWFGCSSLTSFPLIDTSSGIDFSMTWRNCSSLTSFPLIDTSSGTSFSGAWKGCSSLANFPSNFFDGSLCTNFTDAFINTALTQASIDDILVSINSNSTSNGTFDQSGGSAPSATGEAAIDALRARGWTVTVTGGY